VRKDLVILYLLSDGLPSCLDSLLIDTGRSVLYNNRHIRVDNPTNSSNTWIGSGGKEYVKTSTSVQSSNSVVSLGYHCSSPFFHDDSSRFHMERDPSRELSSLI
jgi:hypothetical protein